MERNRQNYKKLVRDRIPEILNSKGIEFGLRRLNDSDYQEALLVKLVEEATEILSLRADLTGTLATDQLHQSNVSRLIEELADLFEVVDSIIQAYGISPSAVREIQERKRSERGAFQERIELLWTLEP